MWTARPERVWTVRKRQQRAWAGRDEMRGQSKCDGSRRQEWEERHGNITAQNDTF